MSTYQAFHRPKFNCSKAKPVKQETRAIKNLAPSPNYLFRDIMELMTRTQIQIKILFRKESGECKNKIGSADISLSFDDNKDFN